MPTASEAQSSKVALMRTAVGEREWRNLDLVGAEEIAVMEQAIGLEAVYRGIV